MAYYFTNHIFLTLLVLSQFYNLYMLILKTEKHLMNLMNSLDPSYILMLIVMHNAIFLNHMLHYHK